MSITIGEAVELLASDVEDLVALLETISKRADLNDEERASLGRISEQMLMTCAVLQQQHLQQGRPS